MGVHDDEVIRLYQVPFEHEGTGRRIGFYP